jgi:hypothetical protein
MNDVSQLDTSYGEPDDLFWVDTDEEYFNDLTTRNWPTLSRWTAIALTAPEGAWTHIEVKDGVEMVTFIARLVEHAISYASRGWYVFPLKLREKVSHKSAAHSDGRKWGQTIDANEIRRDFRQWPDANIGIATGEASGFFVVETDTADGHGEGVDGAAELAMLEAEHGALPATREAISPSGSVHRYFKHPGFKIKNSASLIGPGIDVRGDGGMVVAPPSVKLSKGLYSWRNDLPIADAAPWLLDRIVAGKVKPEPELSISRQAAALVVDPYARSGTSNAHGEGYIEAALRGEYDEVMRAPKGQRNSQLNTSSLKLGHYVGSGVIDEKKVIDEMMRKQRATCRRRQRNMPCYYRQRTLGWQSAAEGNPGAQVNSIPHSRPAKRRECDTAFRSAARHPGQGWGVIFTCHQRGGDADRRRGPALSTRPHIGAPDH